MTAICKFLNTWFITRQFQRMWDGLVCVWRYCCWWRCRHTCFIHLLHFFNWTTIRGLLRRSEAILFKKATITILCCCLHNDQSHCSGPSFPLRWLAVSHTAASLPSCTRQQSWCPRFIKKRQQWNEVTLSPSRPPADADPTNQKHPS